MSSEMEMRLQVSRDNRSVAVSVTGRAEMQADIAELDLRFEVYGVTEQDAYADALERSNRIVDALLARGVERSAIESANQGIAVVEDAKDGKRLISDGYRFRFHQSWTARVTAEAAASVLDAAILAGANRSGGIQWMLSDPAALQRRAEENALRLAGEAAARVAGGLGARVGGVLYASNQLPAKDTFPGFFRRSQVPGDPVIRPLALLPNRIERTSSLYAIFAIE